jgi:hypothetical protein
MSTCIHPELQDCIKTAVTRQVREMAEQIQAQMRTEVDKNLSEQFMLFRQQQLLSAKDGPGQMMKEFEQSQCPYTEQDIHAVEWRVKSHIEQTLDCNTQQMKRYMEDKASFILQEAESRTRAHVSEQLTRNDESLKLFFEEKLISTQHQILQGTAQYTNSILIDLESYKKQIGEELKAAMEYMRQCLSQEIAGFQERVLVDFRILVQRLENAFAAQKSEVANIIQMEFLNMQKILQDELSALRQEYHRDTAAIKEELAAFRRESQHDLAMIKDAIRKLAEK